MTESATRGLGRLHAITEVLDQITLQALLEKLQAPPIDEMPDLKTLQHVFLGLEELMGPRQPHPA